MDVGRIGRGELLEEEMGELDDEDNHDVEEEEVQDYEEQEEEEEEEEDIWARADTSCAFLINKHKVLVRHFNNIEKARAYAKAGGQQTNGV